MDYSASGMYHSLRKIINVVDDLRDIGLHQYINLPRIAVLGTQSSGKSSLLEMIVGIDFLPRGEGVVTRRPLELRLVHTPALKAPYAEFEQVPGQKFSDFDQVRDKINKLTEKIAGKNKGIIDEPIILTVHAESCPDLTVIDLPGITRIPLAGSDQKQDIEKITKDMALRYVKDPRTIVLCVISANADISTSDALQMAMTIDPEGTRTLGVITKIDIMDRGTNAKNMLLGNDIPLKLGYIGVKGRSQQDILDKISVKKGLEAEKSYFASHSVYSTMPSGHVGTDSLVQKLTKIFYEHIKSYMPEIYKEIVSKINEGEERLRELGTPLPNNEAEKLQFLWHITARFCENFKAQLKGQYDMNSPEAHEVSSAAKIRQMFNEVYSEFISKKYRATADYSDKDIERAIMLHEGDTIPGFPSIDAFMYLLQPQLEKLKEPAVDLLNGIYNYLEEVAVGTINKQLQRFPMLIDEFIDMVCKFMDKEKDATRSLVERIIDAEQGFLFTNDMEYLTNRTTIIPKESAVTDPSKVFINEMRHRIDAYFAIVCRNVRDSIPKAIGHFLVRATQDNLQFAIYTELNKSNALLELLDEPLSITEERETLKATLVVLHKAANMLRKDTELSGTLTNKSAKTDEQEFEERKQNFMKQSQKPKAVNKAPVSVQQENEKGLNEESLNKEKIVNEKSLNQESLNKESLNKDSNQQTEVSNPLSLKEIESQVPSKQNEQQQQESNSPTLNQSSTGVNPFLLYQKGAIQRESTSVKKEENSPTVSKPKDTVRVANNSLFGSFISKKK